VGKGGVRTMPGNRQQHGSSILAQECSYCGSTVYIEVEKTTADEYNDTMVSNSGQNGALEATSQEKRLIPHHKIKEALNRLKSKYGFGIPDKKGENDDEETLQVNSNDAQKEYESRRVYDIQGQPGIGHVYHF